MSELYDKSLTKLELDQILAQLAECAGSTAGKEACLRIRPISDLEEVKTLLEQTTAASDICTRKGNPSFSGVTDVSASLERADRGGCQGRGTRRRRQAGGQGTPRRNKRPPEAPAGAQGWRHRECGDRAP